MSFGGAGGQRVPPLRRPLRLRSGSRSGRNDRACDWATSNVKGKVKVKVKIKIKIKVKGNGQECPFHTCKSNVNVEGCAAGVRFPTSRKGREKWGIPVLIGCRPRQDQRQGQRMGVFVLLGRRFAPLTDEASVAP
jgi:hypothetical protein